MTFGYLVYTKYEANRNDGFIKILIDSAKKRDIELKLLYKENIVVDTHNKQIIYDGKNINIPSFVIARVMDYKFYEDLETLGIRVFNKSIISKLFDNKFNAYNEINKLGIPLLDTIKLNKNIHQNFDNLTFPNVTKPIDSKGGDRVFYNTNESQFLNSIKQYDDEFLVQKPSDIIGKDLRVYVIGKNIITSILRISNSGFLSNYCKGGQAVIYNLNEYELKIVNKIINSFDFDYVGIDFLFNNDGIVFSEIENVVGARMVYDLTKINIGDKLIVYIKNNYE